MEFVFEAQKFLNVELYNWNAISEIEMFAQRFFYYCGSSSSYVWRENMTRDNYLNVLSDKWISSSLSLSLSLSLCILLLILEWLLFEHLLFTHITNSYCMIYWCCSLAEFMQSNLISKECHQLYQATKYKLLKDRLFFDHKYVPILISTFFFEMKNAKMKSRRLFISCKTFIIWKIDV